MSGEQNVYGTFFCVVVLLLNWFIWIAHFCVTFDIKPANVSSDLNKEIGLCAFVFNVYPQFKFIGSLIVCGKYASLWKSSPIHQFDFWILQFTYWIHGNAYTYAMTGSKKKTVCVLRCRIWKLHSRPVQTHFLSLLINPEFFLCCMCHTSPLQTYDFHVLRSGSVFDERIPCANPIRTIESLWTKN